MPSNEVEKKIEQMKRKKREPIPADEELKKKANEILCCVYIVANSEQERNVYETDIIKEVNLKYNINYQSNLPENVMQHLANNKFIKRGGLQEIALFLQKKVEYSLGILQYTIIRFVIR